MRYFASALLIAAVGFSATLSQYGRVSFQGDSLAGSPARTEITWGAMLDAGSLQLDVRDSYLTADAGGTVPRWTRGGNDLLVSARASFDRFLLKPDLRWQTAMEGDSIQLGVPTATPLAQGDVIRPGGTVSFEAEDFQLYGFGRYWQRSMTAPTDEESNWASSAFGGGGSWITPLGAVLGVSGTSRSHTADVPELDRDWSRLDLSVSAKPLRLPARTQVMADMKYSLYTGEDYTGGEIADRLSMRVRAVQSLSPSVSYNMTMATALDDGEDGWSVAKGMAGARVLFILDRGGEVPSTLNIGSSFSSSVITTTCFDLFSRVNVSRMPSSA